MRDITNNTTEFEKNTKDITKNLKAEIDNLKAEIVKLKTDNNDKVKTVAKIHLMEIQELQKENITTKSNLENLSVNNNNKLIEAHAHDVNAMKTELEDARNKLKLCQEEDVNETRECLIENAALLKELEMYKQKYCNDCKTKTETKTYMI